MMGCTGGSEGVGLCFSEMCDRDASGVAINAPCLIDARLRALQHIQGDVPGISTSALLLKQRERAQQANT